MYSSFAAFALSLRAKPSFPTSRDDDLELFPLNPNPSLLVGGRRHLLPLLNGYLLRHSAHLLLLSGRLRPPPAPPSHCRRRLPDCRCCCSRRKRLDLGHGCRCSGCGAERSALGRVAWRLEARGGCRCRSLGGGSRPGVLREEVWEYEGGEWPQRRCSVQCRCDWWEVEDGDGEWEVRESLRWKEGVGRFRGSERRWEGKDYEDEDNGIVRRGREMRERKERPGGFRDSDRRRREERDYYDEESNGRFRGSDRRRRGERDYYDDERNGGFRDSDRRRREERDYYNEERNGGFGDSDQRRREESDYYDEEDSVVRRRVRNDANVGRGRFRDFDRRRKAADYYDDEEHDQQRRDRRAGSSWEFSGASQTRRGDVCDVQRGGVKRHSEDDQRFDRHDLRRERGDKRGSEFNDAVGVRREEVRQYREDDERFDRRDHQRSENDKERDVLRFNYRHAYDDEYDSDEQDAVGRKYYSGERTHKSTRASALHEDDGRRGSTSNSGYAVDARTARKEENLASRGQWHDNVDRRGVRRAEHASEERDGRYSASAGWAHDKRDDSEYAREDERLVKKRDSRTRTQDIRVITEDDTSLASSSKITSILKQHSNIDQQVAAHKDSRKSSQQITDISEVRDTDAETDSRLQRYYQESRAEDIKDKSAVQNSVQLAKDGRRHIGQWNEVDQQVATLPGSRKLVDVSEDSSHNVSKASHSQRSYNEVRETDSSDTSTSVQNLIHVTRDKKRYVNQQVIHETDIDVQNITHVDVTNVRASDAAISSSSQSRLETRADGQTSSTSAVNLVERANERQEQTGLTTVCDSGTTITRSSPSHLDNRTDDRVYSISALNIDDSTWDRQGQIDLTKVRASDTAIARSSQRQQETRRDDRVKPTSAFNIVDSSAERQEQIDLTMVRASDSATASSVSHVETRTDDRVCSTSAVNLVDRAQESQDRSDQRMTQNSSTERNEGRTQSFGSSQDGGERGRVRQDSEDANRRQSGNIRISNDKQIYRLQMKDNEEGSSCVLNVDETQRRIVGDSQQETRNEAIVRGRLASSSSSKYSVTDSMLESAAQLEKSSGLHVGQFVNELHKGISDADTSVAHKDGKSINEGVTRSSSRSRMKGPSDEMWDVHSATFQETFKMADKEGSSAVGATDSALQTPSTETAVARRVHKPLWAYVADIIRLGWLRRGESHDSSKKSPKKGSSTNSQSSEGWFSGQENNDNDTRKKSGSTTPKEQQVMKMPIGESYSTAASVLNKDSMDTPKQGLQISEVGKIAETGTSKRGLLAKSSSIDMQRSGSGAKVSEVGTSAKTDVRIGGVPEASTLPLIDIRGGLPEPGVSTPSQFTTEGLLDLDTRRGGLFVETSSTIVNPEHAAGNGNQDGVRIVSPSNIIPDQKTATEHESIASVLLEFPELPSGGSTRLQEKLVIQEAPEVVRTDGKDAELKRRKFQRNKQVLKETFDEWEEAYLHDAEQRKTDEFFMREALVEAQRAADIWEVPVGAVLVQNGEIIARGCNLVEDLRDSTAHAEMICIREASNKLRTWRLADATLYVTLEPCAMCAGAVLQARIDTVVWGAPNKLLGADGSWVRLFPGDGQTISLDPGMQNQTVGPVHPFHPKITIRRGVLASECGEIMQQFFHLRRKKKQKPEQQPPTPPSCLPVPSHPIKFFTKMHHMFNAMFCM